MTIGEALQALGDRLYALWPLRMVSEWESGIRVRAGKIVSLLRSNNGIRGTGMHLFLPFFEQIVIEETNVEVEETELQTCKTADGVEVTFSLAIEYRIVKLDQLYRNIHDAGSTVPNKIRAAAQEVALSVTFEEFASQISPKIKEIVDPKLKRWGIDLKEVGLVNATAAPALRLLQEGR